MKARRHEIHSLETPEVSEGRGAKKHVEFEPAREQARHKTHEVQEHLRHVRHENSSLLFKLKHYILWSKAAHESANF